MITITLLLMVVAAVAGDTIEFRFSAERMTWSDAEKQCVKWGGHLATISSSAENVAVVNELKKMHVANAWIGLNDILKEGEFRWAAGARDAYHNFGHNEPNGQRRENCVEVRKDWNGKWNDNNCGKRNAFVCQRHTAGRMYDCKWLRGKYGVTLNCPNDYVAAGACGSGAGGDCGYFIWTKLKCCRVHGGTDSIFVKKQGGYGSVLKCPNQMAVRSLCESGANGDCGWWIWNRISCSKMRSHIVTSTCGWKYGVYGATLTCDGGQVMTGACGSGRGLDCPNHSAHGIKCCNFEQPYY